MKVNAYILLGGLLGNALDAPTDLGMYSLNRQLAAIAGVSPQTYFWGSWESALQDMSKVVTRRPREAIALIGYSGGGTRATYLATATKMIIDLMVLYDPSPRWQMKPINGNVRKAINFYNQHPDLGDLGGGVLRKSTMNVSTNLITINISEEHLVVDSDQKLHDRTIQEIRALLDA